MQLARFLGPVICATLAACSGEESGNSDDSALDATGATSVQASNGGIPNTAGTDAAVTSPGSASPPNNPTTVVNPMPLPTNTSMPASTTSSTTDQSQVPATSSSGGSGGAGGQTGGNPFGDGQDSDGITPPGGGGSPAGAGGGGSDNGDGDGMEMPGGTGAAAGGAADEGPMTGEELYMAYCAVCHGADATGGDLGPSVRYVDNGLAHFLVREGRMTTTYPESMIPIPQELLTDDGVDLVVEYLWSFPKPTTGQELFVQVCGNCHGADGAGGPTGRPVIGEGHEAQRLVRNGHNGAYDDRREFMPSYDQTQISDQELQMIIDFIDTL